MSSRLGHGLLRVLPHIVSRQRHEGEVDAGFEGSRHSSVITHATQTSLVLPVQGPRKGIDWVYGTEDLLHDRRRRAICLRASSQKACVVLALGQSSGIRHDVAVAFRSYNLQVSKSYLRIGEREPSKLHARTAV